MNQEPVKPQNNPTSEPKVTPLEMMLRIIELSHKQAGWMLTTGMAIMGFLLALLVQIKLAGRLPYKKNALFAMLFLSSSIMVNFYYRIRYYEITWQRQFSKDWKIALADSQQSDEKDSREAKARQEHKEMLKLLFKYRNPFIMPIQYLLWVIGALLAIVYLGRFLFIGR